MIHDLIDRYLAAIARDLQRERTDIVAELRDELMSGVEAREKGLGRPMTEAETGAMLVEFGNPLVVAGRYRKTQHLIGPQVFPFWWAAMKATLVVIAAVYVILIVLKLIGGGALSANGLGSPISTMVFAFGVVTLVFALIERFGDPQKMARWRPERLPPAEGKRASRFELLTELGMGIVFLLWWTGAIHFRDVFGDIGLQVEMAPVWQRFFWWIVAYLVVELASNVVALLRPDRVQLVRWMVIWRSMMGAAILLGVIQAERFLIVSGPAGKAQAIFELWMRVGLGIAIAVFVARAAIEASRLRQDGLTGRAPA
ncbi:MAG: hypothetical protein JHD15_09245 [Phenylobacterium sp.]|uniref:hypothetical protein n=1 Tax=Phenylobacterium sp. TaxID=1871053 RepID=UPI001A236C11|nr:hypothetical protein [Phenylobacterium sp.]MBJ7410534.1 hypothetical protein [Phenylobacterium sp.]